jgi:hypothetical protein
MKTTNKPHYLVMALIVAVVSAATWSCNKDDDPSLAALREDKLQYVVDSLRISDSLKRINAAGVVNYAITVVSGSTSTLFKSAGDDDRVSRSKATVAGAVVTISQFGKVEKDTTDESGMVVFNGFFRTAVNVTIEKEGFTTVSYISVVNKSDSTVNSGIYFVGNLIPVFELTGQNTATIMGRATIETNLTNKTRENVPDGTVITANIDITEDNGFPYWFLTSALAYYGTGSDSDLMYVGDIVDAAYSTDIFGVVSNGAYSITVPAAIDGLPLSLEYSAIVANQTLYEFTNGNKVATYRTIFDPNGYTPSAVDPGAEVGVSFTGDGAGATGYAVITGGSVTSIVVTSGGSGYTTAPTVAITTAGPGLGSGATATATITNGVVNNNVVITAGGSGYVSANTPSGLGVESFSTTLSSPLVKTRLTYINDIHYGTGVRQPN